MFCPGASEGSVEKRGGGAESAGGFLLLRQVCPLRFACGLLPFEVWFRASVDMAFKISEGRVEGGVAFSGGGKGRKGRGA